MDFGTDIARGVLALIFVLGLIGVLTALARRFGFGYRTGSRGAQGRRLSIAEVMPVDSRRRLMLVRRDGVEHLVLLGTGTTPDLLVESGIEAPAGSFSQALAESGGARAEAVAPPAKERR